MLLLPKEKPEGLGATSAGFVANGLEAILPVVLPDEPKEKPDDALDVGAPKLSVNDGRLLVSVPLVLIFPFVSILVGLSSIDISSFLPGGVI